jgi:hypothetical protein
LPCTSPITAKRVVAVGSGEDAAAAAAARVAALLLLRCRVREQLPNALRGAASACVRLCVGRWGENGAAISLSKSSE